ncbi:MAG TPA: ribosomal RNA small subunit methyltransferase A [Lentisphaeria bacterium]|nr:MAG: ribosomal RNA small subunit methyltransferase A [Lentisphaerae bacterium GWF2_50_93]HCE41995.1 ribosomal RNA small subunit methyltransferase A [Lentisphaeria bacterium]
MNKKELLPILAELGVTPGKHFGQNFMIDDNLLDFICRKAAPAPGETILEIGPGLGSLTRKLLEAGAKVTAIEIDKRLADYLERSISNPNFRLVRGDACRLDIQELMPCEFRIVANLPYSITSPFIARIIDLENPPSGMLFMLQKETGMRLASGPGTKNYGSLSVFIQSVYTVEYLRGVAPQVFFPAPEVDSAIVKFTRREEFPCPGDRQILHKLVRAAFSQRRKMMFKQVAAAFAKEEVEKAYASMGISMNARAEELTVKQFLAMARIVGKTDTLQ